ncbi:MAG TPA: hypothetical protein VF885_13630 [Arthrobacter sp.]
MSTHDSRPSPFIRALRSASPALWPLRMRLTSLKAAYKSGSHSGHPEEMLESIEGVERQIRQRINGTRPVKRAAVKSAPAIRQEPVQAPYVRSHDIAVRREFEELTARSDNRGGPFEEGLEAAQRRLAHMQYLYRTGGYMGHPEELLNDIDDEERRVDRLKAETVAS